MLIFFICIFYLHQYRFYYYAFALFHLTFAEISLIKANTKKWFLLTKELLLHCKNIDATENVHIKKSKVIASSQTE